MNHAVKILGAVCRSCRSIPILLFLLNIHLAAQEGFEVRDIVFNGNKIIPASELEDVLSMHTVSWFNRVILQKDPYWFNQNSLDNDIAVLKYLYHTEGYLNAGIKAALQEIDWENQYLSVVFEITESIPVAVDKVIMHIMRDSTDSAAITPPQKDEIRQRLILTTGKRFRDEDLRGDRQRLINYFLNTGFPYVDVGYDFRLKNKKELVDIEWQIYTGPVCTFGEIEILGNEVVDDGSIREQLSFEKGSVFQQQLIDTSHRDVYSLGMFKAVSMHAVLDRQKKSSVPIKVEVREAPVLSSRFGAGYGTEEHFRAFVDLIRLGFLGNTRRLSLYLKHSGLEPYNINLEFTQPAFLHRRASLQLNPYLRRQDEPGYKVTRKGIRTSLIYDFSQRIFSSFSYIYENVSQDTVSSQRSTYESNYNKQMFVINFSVDRTLPRFDPDRGNYIGINLKLNGLLLKTPLPFNKILLDFRRFQKVVGMVMGVKLKIGAITPTQSNDLIPVEERFYGGGSSSLRGWSRAQLGPLNSEGNPTGGNSLWESSVEFRFPVADPLFGAFFLDFGNVWEPSFYYRLNDLRYSAGAGIRYTTFIGPVRLDVARPIFETERAWQLHFSVGHAF